ncbi:hypothetical protein [Paractinoplanes rishiriensis]|uniref:Uncharacterized protein n=1 Tax=Paractinoplanes rishiriensis TaxID=1050105 RepID=A0A919JUL8_9ACTN|nr:hypothetical protein [Actinoplanes rishiriensis]GIE95068.1 hypothetical protein Ari01nite_25330 [Actinoplanes rishiriensis]
MAKKHPMERLLRDRDLPERLVRAVLEVLPAALSDQTAFLLAGAIRQWDDRSNAMPAALTEGWQQDGGVPAELDRLRAMFRYRRERQRYKWFYESGQAMRDSEEELRSFWVTTGHDVADLDRYMAGVDAEFPDMSAG